MGLRRIFAVQQENRENMAVKELTDKDFKSTISSEEKVVVKYFADWCGACKLIAPKFKRMSDDERFQGIVFSETNAEKNEEAREAAGVSNLPYFAVFKNGEFVEGSATSKIDKVEELVGKIA